MKTYNNIELKTKKILNEGIGQWIVTINGDDWKDIIKSAEKSTIDQLQIPGFRKGKVPANIALKHINQTSVLRNAGNKAMKVAYQYGLEQSEIEVKVTNQPEVEITDLSTEKCVLNFNFDLPLEVELKEYHNLDVDKPNIKITKSEIDQQLQLLKDRFAVYSPKEAGSLESGDVAIFDFKGTIEGKDFPGGDAKNFELEIGSKRFIPGFEEQMVGMTLNEHKIINIRFPKDYHVENLIDKEVQFSIDLKEIKVKTVNDDNEELVKDVNLPNVKTYQELLNHIKEQLTNQKTNNMRQEFIDNIFTTILKSSKVVIPKTAINKETERLVNDFKSELEQKNVSLEEYKSMTGYSDEDIKAEAKKDALWQLQTYLITEEVVKEQKIEVSQEEIDEYLVGIANQFNMPLEQIKQTIKDLSYVSTTLKRKKALDWLFENNGHKETKVVIEKSK